MRHFSDISVIISCVLSVGYTIHMIRNQFWPLLPSPGDIFYRFEEEEWNITIRVALIELS